MTGATTVDPVNTLHPGKGIGPVFLDQDLSALRSLLFEWHTEDHGRLTLFRSGALRVFLADGKVTEIQVTLLPDQKPLWLGNQKLTAALSFDEVGKALGCSDVEAREGGAVLTCPDGVTTITQSPADSPVAIRFSTLE